MNCRQIDFIDRISKSTELAEKLLTGILFLPKENLTLDTVTPIFQQAVYAKLMIPDTQETNLKKLIISGIKSQDLQSQNLPDEVIMQEIKKYDCHQTSLIARKKVLLLMYIEKVFGITLTDDEAVNMETIEQMAQTFLPYLQSAGGGRGG